MKTLLSCTRLYCVCACRTSFTMYQMDALVVRSDIVVYCDEKDIHYKITDHGNWKETETFVKCKVLRTFKGGIEPGTELTVDYNDIFRRCYGIDGLTEHPTNRSTGQRAAVPAKDKSGTYVVTGAKLVQNEEVFMFEPITNSRPHRSSWLPHSLKTSNWRWARDTTRMSYSKVLRLR